MTQLFTRPTPLYRLPRENPTFWQDVGNSYKYSYLPVIRAMERTVWGEDDPNFKVTREMLTDQPVDLIQDLMRSKSQKEFDHRRQTYDDMLQVKEELGINNAILPALFSGIFDPITLIPIPALKGVGFARGLKRGLVGGASVGVVSEGLRAPFDPTNTGTETALNLTGATFFGSLFGGGIGYFTKKRSGQAYAEQTAIDDAMPGSETLTKTVKVKDGDNEFTVRKESDDTLTENTNKLYEENGLKRKEDLLGLSNKDEEARPADSFGYAEFTLKATPYGRNATDYKSETYLRLLNSIAGDGGIKYKTNETGRSLMPNSSVLLLQGRWSGVATTFEANMQNFYLRQFGIKEPKTIVGQNIPYTGYNIASKLRKDVPDPVTFFEDVGEYVIREKDDPNFKANLDTEYDKAVKAGADEFKKNMDLAKEDGFKSGFFNTFKSNNQRLEYYIDEYANISGVINSLEKTIANPKVKKTGALEAKYSNALDYASQLSHEIDVYESMLYTELKKIDRANKTLDDIVDRAVERKMKAQSLITVMQDKLQKRINRKLDLKKMRREMLVKAKENYNTDMDTLQGLLNIEENNFMTNLYNEKKISTLSEAQRKFKNDLWERIQAYHADPRSRMSKKQQEFFQSITDRLNQPDSFTPKQIKLIRNLLKQIKEPVTPNEVAYAQKLKQQLNNFNYARIARNQDIEDYIGTSTSVEKQKPNYFTRVWKVDTIKDEEEFFRNTLLRNWFVENPSGTYLYFRKQKSAGKKAVITERKGNKVIKKEIEVTDEILENQLQKQIDTTYARIISSAERQDLDNIHATGFKKIQLSRDLTIPNYKLLSTSNGVADFIDKNSVSVMRQYMNKFGPMNEMTRMFKGDRQGMRQHYDAYDDIITKYRKEFDDNPNKQFKKLYRNKSDLEELTNVILNRIPKDFDVGSISNRATRGGLNFATITMMGSAALASVGKIILARGLRQTMGRYAGTWISDIAERNLRDESNKFLMQITGEGLEVISGSGMARVQEVSTGIGEINNRKLGGVGDKVFEWLDKTAGKFYNLNLLNHWTALNKRLVMPMSVDRIVRVGAILNKEYKGNQTPLKFLKADQDILLSYGLTKNDLQEIHRVWKLFGGEKKYRGKEIFYDNSQLWADARPELFRKYMGAIRADILFTIITPTEADKPLLSHGIFKGSRWSKYMKDRQHNIFKASVQFMSWAFGANNKIVISGLQGRHQGYFSGITAMIALGMTSDYIRNPEWWKYKSTDEKLIKAIEYSGITSYLLDINNFAEVVTNNGIGIRPMFGSENPFTGKARDQISEVGGPLGSILSDVYGFMYDDTLEQRDKVRMVRRMIPFNNLLYTKWLFNLAQRNIQDPKKQPLTLPID